MPTVYFAAMFLQARDAVPSGPIELIQSATTVTQAVLIVLGGLSFLSWSIMFGVWRSTGKARRAADRFLRDFELSTSLDEALVYAKRSPGGALPRLLARAVRFLADTRVSNQHVRERLSSPIAVDAPSMTLSGSQIETLHLLLDTQAGEERDRIGRFLPWLATIGSVSPLIGLLGTVLGIIEAFLGIATKGSGNLAAVAPGVGEALTATAAALAVAIPATFGYNIFASRLNRFDGKMESFSSTLIALLVREGLI
jgi:biopolymer transport protein TolQ